MIFAESIDTVARDILLVRPTVMTGVPRIYEKIHSRIVAKGHEGSAISRRLFDWADKLASRLGGSAAAHRKPGPWLAWQAALADRLVFRRIRDGVGGRIRLAVSGSAPLSPHLAQWFFGVGLPLIEGYGLTETSPVLTAPPLNGVRFGTVGPPLPNVEIRIAPDGEILARGPNVMLGYYNRLEETAAALADGWFHTGDIGEFDAEGYLKITDRKKDVLCTSGGKKIAPQPIEARLRESDLILEAMLIGDRRNFISAILIPDFAELARALGVPRPADERAAAALLAQPDVRARYAQAIEDVNAHLAQFERIKKFYVLPRELTQAAGELTPTLKIKRRVVETEFQREIEEMYKSEVYKSKEP
jgi:long-chain acyl-CoA synthetase